MQGNGCCDILNGGIYADVIIADPKAEEGGFYELWLDFQSTYSISQKFNSTTSAAWRTCCWGTRW